MGSGPSCRLVVLGPEAAGKTSVLYRLRFRQYTSTQPTVQFNVEKVVGWEGACRGVTFTLWDVGGRESLRPLWKSYLRAADGAVFVVDSSDLDGLEEARVELARLLTSSGGAAGHKLTKPGGKGAMPLLVLANKQDLAEALPVAEVRARLGAEVAVLPCCAVTGEGLEEALDHMYQAVKDRRKNKR